MPNLDSSKIRTWGDLQFVRVSAGKFLMGSMAGNHLADSGERPQHTVDLPDDYWIARYPVTNEQFAEFVTAAKHEFNQGRWQAKADHPVVAVSWREALAYCQWLNAMLRGELKDLTPRLPGVRPKVPPGFSASSTLRSTAPEGNQKCRILIRPNSEPGATCNLCGCPPASS